MIEGHSIGDGIIVAALAGAFIAYLYFKHLDRQRRLEMDPRGALGGDGQGHPAAGAATSPGRAAAASGYAEPRSCTASCGRRSVPAP